MNPQPHLDPTLDSLRPADAKALFSLLSDPEVVRYMLIPLAQAEDEAKHFIETANQTDAGIRWQTWAIRLAGSSEIAGVCGLGIKEERQDAEIWYLLHPGQWGKGIASGVVDRILAIAFDDFMLHRVWATCLPENPASARVLEKNLFRREGFLRRSLRIQGEWRDAWLYAILVEEFRAGRSLY